MASPWILATESQQLSLKFGYCAVMCTQSWRNEPARSSLAAEFGGAISDSFEFRTSSHSIYAFKSTSSHESFSPELTKIRIKVDFFTSHYFVLKFLCSENTFFNELQVRNSCRIYCHKNLCRVELTNLPHICCFGRFVVVEYLYYNSSSYFVRIFFLLYLFFPSY